MTTKPISINEEAGLGPNWVPVDAPPIIPGKTPPAPGVAYSESSKYLQGSIPQSFQLSPNFVATEVESSNTPNYSLTPLGVQGNPVSNAGIQSTALKVIDNSTPPVAIEVNGVKIPDQQFLNLTGTGVTTSGKDVIFTATGDGLTHGTTPWETDPSYYAVRDDFITNFSTAAPYGNLPWTLVVSSAGTLLNGGSLPPNMGNYVLSANSNAANAGAVLLPECFVGPTTLIGVNPQPLPLFDYPGWTMTWIFKLDKANQASSVTNPYDITKFATYVGMAGAGTNNNQITFNSMRPTIFAGVRYDTDNGLSFTITSVANAAGGQTVYTGVFSATNTLNFQQVTISGFVNAVNNGTFAVASNTATTITVNNPSGAAETHAATATTPAIGDTTFKMEWVYNHFVQAAGIRNNIQGGNSIWGTNGATVDTTITPVRGVYYRLNMSCFTSGQLIMTLTGGGNTFTHTFTLAQFQPTCRATGGSYSAGAGTGLVAFGGSNSEEIWICPGNKVTVSGLTGTGIPLNGSWVTTLGYSNNVFFVSALTIGAVAATPQLSYYPGMYPMANSGNDSTAVNAVGTLRGTWLDYFSFVYSPGLQTNPPSFGTNTARYW